MLIFLVKRLFGVTSMLLDKYLKFFNAFKQLHPQI